MAAPYSLDLRKKIVAVYEEGNKSYSEVAKSFKISIITAKRYVKQYRRDGNLMPQKSNCGRPSKIDETGYQAIQKIIQDYPTITLGELAQLYYKKRKIKAGRSVLSRACQKLNLRRKKPSLYAAERDRDDIKKNAKSIAK